MNDEYYIELALNEARKAKLKNEVPIGCIITKNNQIISKSYNHKTLDNIATSHAEILAINNACKQLGTWYLDDCTLYTTVEPCMMCTGAIIQARISKVVYGAKNDSFGYLSKLKNSKIKIISGIKEKECIQILSEFFQARRIENQQK